MTADPTLYLDITGSDPTTYGVVGATADQVRRASRLVDAHCRRAGRGFTFTLDMNGQPACMANAVATGSWRTTSGISAGSNVTVQLQAAPLPVDMIGRALTLDRTGTNVEVVIPSAINTPSPGYITFPTIQATHSSGTLLEDGLQIFEEKFLPASRSIARVSQWPVVQVRAALGRYSYGRTTQQIAGDYSEFNLLAILQNFGGPPAWIGVDVAQIGINSITGEMWVPAGVLLAYYSDFRVWYVAGYPVANLPPEIKQATANIIRNNSASEGLGSMFKIMKAGDASLERFADQATDDETATLLRPHRARLFA